MTKKERKNKFDSFCSICGFPLHKYQIAAIIDDTMIMCYEDRCYTEFSAHICSECWEKIKQNNLGGMDRAIKRLNNLKKLNKEMKN